MRKREGFRCVVIGTVGQGGRRGLAGSEASCMISLGSTFGLLWLGLSWKPRPKKKKNRDAGSLLTKFWQFWECCCRVMVWLPKLVASEVAGESSVVICSLSIICLSLQSHHRRNNGKWSH